MARRTEPMTTPDIDQMLARNKTIWDTADTRPTWDPADEMAGHWAEQRKDEAAMPYADPRQDDRAADDYYERRWGA